MENCCIRGQKEVEHKAFEIFSKIFRATTISRKKYVQQNSNDLALQK